MKTFITACGLLVVLVGLGVFIGLKASPPGPGKTSDAQPLSKEFQAVEEKAIPVVEPKPRLNLHGVAVVDLARLIAAHPRSAGCEEVFAWNLTDAQSIPDKQGQAAAIRKAELQRDEMRRRLASDIQKIIASYAATNNFSLVLDRSASPRPDRPVVQYSSNKVDYIDVTTASGVKDITQAILQLLSSEPPNNGPKWTRR